MERHDEQHNENEKLKGRLREIAQILIAEVGTDGPTDAEEAARRAVKRIEWLQELLRECDGKLGRKPCQHERCMEYVRLREAITEANEAMRDGSDLTAWAILVAALAGNEEKT